MWTVPRTAGTSALVMPGRILRLLNQLLSVQAECNYFVYDGHVNTCHLKTALAILLPPASVSSTTSLFSTVSTTQMLTSTAQPSTQYSQPTISKKSPISTSSNTASVSYFTDIRSIKTDLASTFTTPNPSSSESFLSSIATSSFIKSVSSSDQTSVPSYSTQQTTDFDIGKRS